MASLIMCTTPSDTLTVPFPAPPPTPHSQGLIGEVWGAGGLHVVEVAVQDVKTIEAHLSTCNGDKAIPERAVGGGCGAIVAAHLWSGTHQWQEQTTRSCDQHQ